MIFSSVFTGGGGADIGARDAGFELGDGLEIDSDIARVANDNLGGHVHVGDILTTDPSLFRPMDLLHASPPCPSFSVANNKKGETELDIALAEKVCEFIRYHTPKLFTLENVMGYRKSKSYALIINTLSQLGYMYDAQILNSANMGVPQTRRRLIVRASRVGMIPSLPEPIKWVGWYEAIEDLIPTLPESKFADWQLKKLKLLGTTTVDSAGFNDASGDKIPVQKSMESPVGAITSNYHRRELKAFIVNTQEDHGEEFYTSRESESPSPTVASTSNGRYKAFIMPTDNASGALPIDSPERFRTITVGHDYIHGRALLGNGKVVAMTPRALARFQSFPDWYQLPEKKLACKIIGNSVPPLMYQRIAEGLLETL